MGPEGAKIMRPEGATGAPGVKGPEGATVSPGLKGSIGSQGEKGIPSLIITIDT